MRRARCIVLALGCCWFAAGHAQEAGQEPGPELDFLEYLGTWAEEDDEWLAIEEWQKGNAAEPNEEPEAPERRKDDHDESE